MSIISYCTKHNRVKMKEIRNRIMLEIWSIMSTSLMRTPQAHNLTRLCACMPGQNFSLLHLYTRLSLDPRPSGVVRLDCLPGRK